jgi:hypothetical protein
MMNYDFRDRHGWYVTGNLHETYFNNRDAEFDGGRVFYGALDCSDYCIEAFTKAPYTRRANQYGTYYDFADGSFFWQRRDFGFMSWGLIWYGRHSRHTCAFTQCTARRSA